MFNYLLAVTAPTNKCGNVDVGTIDLCPKNNTSVNPIYVLIQSVSNWIIGILGLAAVLIVVFSAVQFIASQGNPETIKAAKSRIINAVVGLILLSLMFVILRLILPTTAVQP